jgi:DNA-binding GntR family transcriptional regulator
MTSVPEMMPTPGAGPGAAQGPFESAYHRLRRDIVDGVYAPREHLVETDVARELGVSRATVRAVLLRLQQDGLVEIQPNRGARVRSFSPDETAKIMRVREVLEGLAASLAAEQASAAQLAALRAVVEQMEVALAAGDLLSLRGLNGQFHRIVVDAADSPFVDQILGSLQYPLVRYQLMTILVPGRKEDALVEHQAILACLERRDAAGAEGAARQHVAHVRTTLQQCGLLPL